MYKSLSTRDDVKRNIGISYLSNSNAPYHKKIIANLGAAHLIVGGFFVRIIARNILRNRLALTRGGRACGIRQI